MHNDPLAKSANQLPWFNDWSRYDTPAVFRKHGREYMERLWRDTQGEQALEPRRIEPLATLQAGHLESGSGPVSIRVELHLERRVRS